ncbi:MAG: SDR family oxidoreductase [Thermoleophilia bacterium]|nr:SDR family oxidoreductase [Thermoleophilia bacterium]
MLAWWSPDVAPPRARRRSKNSRDWGKACFMQTDVSRPDECCRLADETAALYGGIDILVNSAGNWTLQPIEEVTEESWDRQFDCNLKGAFFCAQAVVPHMLRRGGGKIVNISSAAGFIGFPGAAVYCASKGGLVTLTKALAVELASRGINVNGIAPGNVETPFNADLMANPDYYRAMVEMTPVGRNGLPEDIAPAIIYLVGDGSSFMQGATMIIDGGVLAK